MSETRTFQEKQGWRKTVISIVYWLIFGIPNPHSYNGCAYISRNHCDPSNNNNKKQSETELILSSWKFLTINTTAWKFYFRTFSWFGRENVIQPDGLLTCIYLRRNRILNLKFLSDNNFKLNQSEKLLNFTFIF